MKKFSFCLLFIMCFFITGCGEPKSKEVTTLERFTEVAENNGFVVIDNSDDYFGIDYIIDSRKANVGDSEIEMVVYDNSENADRTLKQHIESFATLKSTAAAQKDVEGENYHTYFLVSNNRYMISTRVENTLIFSKDMVENKDLIENVINELGY